MSPVRRNLLANFAGKAWAALVGLVCVPIYVRFIGIESFGLIGVYLTLYAVLSLLDMGISTTLNRELARFSARAQSAPEMRDLVRTLEVIYWLVALAIGLAMAAFAPMLGPLWIKADQIPRGTLETALLLMGIAIACQWPVALYSGGLMGLQRQVLFNAIAAATGTVRAIGAVLVLWLIAPSIEAFLAWQILMSVVETMIAAITLWSVLPPGPTPRFRPDVAIRLWRFAAGVSGISLFSVILTQLDKILLSGLLPLAGFGYYMLASRLASGLYYLIGPVTATYFPRYAQFLHAADEPALGRTYHQSCQLMSFLVVPPAVVLALFPYEVLHLWTQDREVAANAAWVLALLAAGTALNALASPPHLLQLASGWTRLALINAGVTVVLMVPLIYVMTIRYGGTGAAAAWFLVNLGNVVVNAIFTHRRLLKGELLPWLRTDVAPAVLATLGVAALWRWLVPTPDSLLTGIVHLSVVSAATVAAGAMATPVIRRLAARSLSGVSLR